MASPYIEFLGVGCALDEIAEQHNDRDEYGRAAIISALGERLKAYNSAIEYVEDLVTAKDDAAKERAISRLAEWSKPWRAGA
ncbi:MAG: hypothetical protein Q7J24_06025 [Desulfomicrobium sp.]|nr:hypothetical protein [Desulfomicrobium sp.]